MKPLVYVVELIFAAVVTIGTADKLLFHPESADSSVRCAFDDSIGACSAVISIGTLCMIGGLYVLWKRVSSAFLCDMKYRNDTETFMCMVLSIGWLSVASIVTHFRAVPSGLESGLLRAERRITITFAWLLWVFHIGSMAIAWFAPDEDDVEEEPFVPDMQIDPTHLDFGEGFEYSLPEQPAPPGFENMTAPTPPELSREFEDIDRPEALQLGGFSVGQIGVSGEASDLSRFLSQHDELEEYQGVGAPTPQAVIDEAMDELRPQESIQDLASVWKDIVTADIEAETPELEISMETEVVGGDASGAGPSQQPVLSARPTLRRRRTVRFEADDVIR